MLRIFWTYGELTLIQPVARDSLGVAGSSSVNSSGAKRPTNEETSCGNLTTIANKAKVGEMVRQVGLLKKNLTGPPALRGKTVVLLRDSDRE